MANETTTEEKTPGLSPKSSFYQAKVGDKTSTLSLSPRNFDELWKMADLISKTDFVPEGFRGKPGSVVAAFQYGAEVGLQPMTSLQWIAVIKGRPTIWGDAALMLVRTHPRFEWHKELGADETESAGYGECTIKLKGEEPKTRRYTIEMAKTAGLWGGKGATEDKKGMSTWANHPGRMLQMRARGWDMRDTIPEAFGGLSIRGEMEDFRDITEEAIIEEERTKATEETTPAKPTIGQRLDAMTAAKQQPEDEHALTPPEPEAGEQTPATEEKKEEGGEELTLTPPSTVTPEDVEEWMAKAEEYAGDQDKMMAYVDTVVPEGYEDEVWTEWSKATDAKKKE